MYKILANTIFLGKDVLFLPECHSTNDMALSLIRQGKAREGSIVICDHQTQGKGQRGNSWEVQKGMNLTFSMVLKPDFLDLSEQFYLNMMVSNAIRKLLQEYVPYVKVKWPNDLVAPGFGKTGGILIENTVGSEGWEFAVVGIGLNINQKKFNVSTATSLALLTGSEFELEEIFKMLVTHLEQGYIALKKGKKSEIRSEYLRHLYLLDEQAVFMSNDTQIHGRIVGVSEAGNLLLETDLGTIKSFGLKEISFPKI
ncbi:biotin--[acetyl-CoA-carboxylase] ligase [Algoriphagus sp. AK58]|uniref:biotin--[acetyl-CoA-carboxylase] ligase n=1 Tax=Algoriphagus sp. AK58 TaxID=1406877 RepID=UPI00164F5080|nr:biotin--[acetyl-CoA-carboxylase] ligase [Algoriphagus sp. AK58]MBC6366656.1 biotin--[acetyl-CoA-carboxylase] ligase [Algoriphagus sp. AK58]